MRNHVFLACFDTRTPTEDKLVHKHTTVKKGSEKTLWGFPIVKYLYTRYFLANN